MRLIRLLPLSLLVFSLAANPVRADLSAQTIADLNSTDPTKRGEALRLRALDHEKQGRFDEAKTDYIESLSQIRKSDNRSRESELFTRVAYCQVRLGAFDDATANIEKAPRMSGWDYSEKTFLPMRSIIFLATDQHQKALDAAARLKQSADSEVIGKYYEACARYFMGDDASLSMSIGNEVFDPGQLPFNRAIYLDPKSYQARVKRARYFVERANQARFPDFYPPTTPTSKGGWLNLIDRSVQTPQSHSFYQNAYFDWSRAIDLEKHPADYAERALVAAMLNDVAKRETDKIPASRITSDIQVARNNSDHKPEVLRALGRFYGSTLPPIDSTGYRPALSQGIRSYSLALLDAPNAPENQEVRDARQNLIGMFFSGKPLAKNAAKAPTAEAWKLLGNELSAKEEVGPALQAYEKALEIDPKYADAMNNIGSLYSKSGAYDIALDWFGKAIASDPKHRIAYYNRASTNSDLGQEERALTDAMPAVQFAVTNAQKSEALALRAQLYYGAKQFDKALTDLNASLAINGEQYGAWATKGQIELEKGAPDAATTSFQKAVKVNEKSQLAVALLAVSQLLQAGQAPAPLDLTASNKGWMASYLKQPRFDEVYARSPQKERLEQARKLFADAN